MTYKPSNNILKDWIYSTITIFILISVLAVFFTWSVSWITWFIVRLTVLVCIFIGFLYSARDTTGEKE